MASRYIEPAVYRHVVQMSLEADSDVALRCVRDRVLWSVSEEITAQVGISKLVERQALSHARMNQDWSLKTGLRVRDTSMLTRL